MKMIKYMNSVLMILAFTACGGGGGTSTPTNNGTDDNPSLVSSDGQSMLLTLTGAGTGSELWTTDGTEENTKLIKDINIEKSSPKITEPTSMNGIVYFSAIDMNFGKELWRSDGTKEGTYVLKDIREGISDSSPRNLTAVGNTLYFTATDGIHDSSLWKSDGTKEGTVRIDKVFVGAHSLIKVGNTLFFSGDDGVHGRELWKSDGTATGTMMVKDSYVRGMKNMLNTTDVNGRLFYVALDTNTSRNSLWTSDGTADGTYTLDGLKASTYWNYTFYSMVDIGSTLVYAGLTYDKWHKNGTDGLWKSDGTHEGTSKIADFESVGKLVNVNGKAYFFGQKSGEIEKLWKSDGTTEGTTAVEGATPKDLNLELNETYRLVQMTEANGKLFYAFYRKGGYGSNLPIVYELWTSDGTEDGTKKLKDFGKIGHDIRYNPSNPLFTKMGNKLYFTAFEAMLTSKTELWSSDGTVAGTTMVHAMKQGKKSLFPKRLIDVNGTLYFTSGNQSYGHGLWKSDGTQEGTQEVEGIDNGTASAYPGALVEMHGTYYFTANDGIHGKELWKSDGTEAGTQMVKDVTPGNQSNVHGIKNISVANDTIYFNTMATNERFELWKSDGSESGTVKIKDFKIDDYSDKYFYQTNYFDINGTVLFRGYDSEHGFELWRSDGTEEGTKLLLDIDSNETSSMPREFLEINDVLYFKANDPVDGKSLWKSDGTVAGTQKLLAFPEGYVPRSLGSRDSIGPRNLTDVNGTLFFTMNVDNNYTELWKSDGTVEGTKTVKRFKKIQYQKLPFGLTNINGVLYFIPVYSDYGWELWKSDGTTEGTTMVKDLKQSERVPYRKISKITLFKNKIYFTLPNSKIGSELWSSDGTEEGTSLFYDVWEGKGSSRSNIRGVLNGELLFGASTESGRKLWKTDGTVSGTTIVKEGFR